MSRRRLYNGTIAVPAGKTPYAHYPLNGDILDVSGNGRHLVVPATQPQFIAGYVAGKQAFSCGTYINSYGLDTPFSFDSTWQDFAIICRVYIDATQPTYPNIFDKMHAGSSKGFNLQRVSSTWTFGITNQSSAATASIAIANGWHTVACVRRRSDGMVGLFVDGALAASGTFLNNVVLDTVQLKIGVCFNWNTARYFNGKIQDFKIYKEALTNAEVIEIMNGI